MSRRIKFIAGGAIVLAVIAFLVISGLKETLVYFVTPEELRAKVPPEYGKNLRLGGLVLEGSLKRGPEPLRISFEVTDGRATVPVTFTGIPPDLFKEGRGVVVEGVYQSSGVFHASTILAKHSEEYRPPETTSGQDAWKTIILEKDR